MGQPAVTDFDDPHERTDMFGINFEIFGLLGGNRAKLASFHQK